jgi:hypothetical protein
MTDSDEEYHDEDYEYEYSDEGGGTDDEDVSMDGSADAADAAASSPTKCMPNKKRPFVSMVDRRKNNLGDNPNAPPQLGGKFHFPSEDSPQLENSESIAILLHPLIDMLFFDLFIQRRQMDLEYACFLPMS